MLLCPLRGVSVFLRNGSKNFHVAFVTADDNSTFIFDIYKLGPRFCDEKQIGTTDHCD